MNEYTFLWLAATWSLYMLVVLFGAAVYYIGMMIWRWRHE
jgi:hypothetical protein